MRKALIRQLDGFVENIIEIEKESKWQPPEGCYLIDIGDASPGDTWDGAKFIKLITPEPEPVRDLEAEIDDLKARIMELEKR